MFKLVCCIATTVQTPRGMTLIGVLLSFTGRGGWGGGFMVRVAMPSSGVHCVMFTPVPPTSEWAV